MSLLKYNVKPEMLREMSLKDVLNLCYNNSFEIGLIELILPYVKEEIMIEIKSEQEMYLEFKKRFPMYKSVKNRNQIYRCYYKPILNKYSEDELRSGIDIKDFIEWYKKYKKAYTSDKNIINILRYYESSILEEFIKYLENNKDKDVDMYKRCVLLGYTGTIQNMKSEIKKLKENMSVNEGVKFCINLQDKYVLIENKIIILEVNNFERIVEIREIKRKREERIHRLRDIAEKTNIRIKYVKEIDLEIEGGIEMIKRMEIEEIVRVIKKFKYKLKIMKIIEIVLDNVDKLKKIQSKLSYEYCKLNKVTYFFLNRPTDELRNIFDNIMSEYDIRLQNTSSYVDDRLKDKELRVVKFLEYIDKYVEKDLEREEEMDNIIYLLKNSNKDKIDDILLKYGRSCNHDNTKVKSKNSKHHQALSPITTAIWFLQKLGKICKCYEYINTLKCSYILNQVENYSELLDWDKRRVYTKEEIDAMINVVESESKDKLLITILREIGLRNSAICNLKFRDIVDDYNCPKHLCRVKEKGNKYREFVTTPNIKKILVTYIHELDKMLEMDKFVFSRSKKLDTKMASATLNNVLKRIALKAGVTNVNVQAHTFRHTLVGTLMDAGNSIELVSKFIGHKSVDTTMTYYWLKNISDLAKEINNPFTKTIVTKEDIKEEKDSEIELLNKKIDTCFQIIGIYKEEIYKSESIDILKDNMSKHDVNINKILKYIADSVSGETVSIFSEENNINNYI